MIYNRLKCLMYKNNLLYFTKNDQLSMSIVLDTVNQNQLNMDQKKYSCGIFIDLQKAFDTVNYLFYWESRNIMEFMGLLMIGFALIYQITCKQHKLVEMYQIRINYKRRSTRVCFKEKFESMTGIELMVFWSLYKQMVYTDPLDYRISKWGLVIW